MQTYGTILNFAMPVFLILYVIERIVAWYKKENVMRDEDSISSLSSGMTNVIKDVLGLSIGIISYEWMVENVAITHIKATWLVYLVAFLTIDFAGYWIHRWEHTVNVFWNRHIIHHSSEEFNLSCALRQTISVVFKFFTFLLLPAALLGVESSVIQIVAPLHLFLQYWYHTRLIDKMGFLEYLIVTPSHHRVHHAINLEYLDKNYGQVFIFWDKWFGTFQEELAEKPPVYGVTIPVQTWNPIKINFKHLWQLIQDAWHAQNWTDKLRLWFMPTGWRPADVKEKYPLYSIKDIYHFPKYDTNPSLKLIIWSWIQLSFNYALMVYLFAYIGEIAKTEKAYIFLYGTFIYLGIYAYCDLLDKNKSAFYLETLKSIICLAFIYYTKDWFGLETHLSFLFYLLILYFVVSPLVVLYFANNEPSAQQVSNI